ncbi:hypothetical protein BDV29DRAFT_164932 [Aspergillus leporis]|uniref:Uncharacterized protein n=1 Tax=Aspergillus leporis TaxID=41062 RepID=A0A5N5XG84_9EURO|nr:hypothetical protein BDV29DRAFT_164932 [Aspergillus leporis]
MAGWRLKKAWRVQNSGAKHIVRRESGGHAAGKLRVEIRPFMTSVAVIFGVTLTGPLHILAVILKSFRSDRKMQNIQLE